MIRRLTAKKTLAVVAATLLVLIGASAALAVTASSSNSSTGGYPYGNAIDCSAKYGAYSWCLNGSDLSKYGYGYRNCTDYVAWKVQQTLGVNLPTTLGDAKTWGPRLKSDGYSYDPTPRVGDIAAWNTGGDGFGHVAYVFAVTNGVATLDEYNVDGTGLFSSNRTTADNSAGAPSEYAHIAQLAAQMPPLGNADTPTTSAPAPTPRIAQPTLGANWPTNGGGFGQVEPSIVSNGGDASSVVTGITWKSWGGAEAIGSGDSDYVPPNAQSAADGSQEPVTIVAFNFGTCAGIPAYTSVEWYFPEYGQTFDPSQGEADCSNPFNNPAPEPSAPAPTTTRTVQPASTSSCPTATQVYAAWIASPGVQIAEPGSVTSFSDVECWENWVIATVLGNGNGDFYFSQTGGLHGLSADETSEFMSAVCSDPSAPSYWQGPDVAGCPAQ